MIGLGVEPAVCTLCLVWGERTEGWGRGSAVHPLATVQPELEGVKCTEVLGCYSVVHWLTTGFAAHWLSIGWSVGQAPHTGGRAGTARHHLHGLHGAHGVHNPASCLLQGAGTGRGLEGGCLHGPSASARGPAAWSLRAVVAWRSTPAPPRGIVRCWREGGMGRG